MSSAPSKEKVRKPTVEPIEISAILKDLNERISSMSLQVDENMKSIQVANERSLRVLHEDMEQVSKALDELTTSRDQHDVMLRDWESKLVSVQAQINDPKRLETTVQR
jgi:chromosome segregation ATPase